MINCRDCGEPFTPDAEIKQETCWPCIEAQEDEKEQRKAWYSTEEEMDERIRKYEATDPCTKYFNEHREDDVWAGGMIGGDSDLIGER